MNDASLNQTLERIDAAVARIQRASSLPRPGDEHLRERHEQLKASVSQALGELDQLIAAQGR